MERSYKKLDSVKVYADTTKNEVVTTLQLKPYSIHGFDSYMYNGTLFPGYQDRVTSEIYIFLSDIKEAYHNGN